MWSKFFRIPVLLLFLVITYNGCVEEPTIDPVKRPYTLLRVANLSYNVDTLIVSIDSGKTVLTLYKNVLPTQYFEIASGKRHFLVKNAAGDIIYNEKISIESYEELSLFFTGYSKPSDDLVNTFGVAQFTNGLVYLYEGLNDTTTTIQFANFAIDTAANVIAYDVQITDTAAKNIVKQISPLGYNGFAREGLKGNTVYKIGYIKPSSSPLVTYKDTVYTFETGYQYYLYCVGNPQQPNFIIEKNIPLSIKSK